MLLHLRSSRDELEAAEFDRRWNQLMPRGATAIATTLPSVITSTTDDEEAEMNFSLAPSDLPKRSPTDIQSTVLPMVHGLSGPGIPTIVRPASFDSEFGSEFNASLLAHAGSLQTSLHSLSTSPGNTPDDMTLDDSFTAMTPHFTFTGNDHSLATNLAAMSPSLSAFEMVSYGTVTGEAEATESEKEIKADVDVNVSSSVLEIPPSSTNTGTHTDEQTDRQETAEKNFDSGEEDWQCFSGVSTDQNVNNSSVSAADGKGESKTDNGELTVNVDNDVGSSGSGEGGKNFLEVEGEVDHNTENDVGSKEQSYSKEGSFCMLKVSVSEDDSLSKSLDVESPAKSTTSSADWCLVSNHTDHSREEELDTVSHVTDSSLPGDCVLVESKGKVAADGLPEEMSNADVGSANIQQDVPECSAADSKEQPLDDTGEH